MHFVRVTEVWQRHRQISDWQPTNAPAEQTVDQEPAGEVELSELGRTVSIQVRGRGDRNEFWFNQVVLERIP